MLHYQAAAATSQGRRRYQEDAFRVLPDGGAGSDLLCVLADGMGGHTGGAIASALVCDSFVEQFAVAGEVIPDRLVAALQVANETVARKIEETPKLGGMGSTLVAATFGTEGVEWVSVGDSPLLLCRRGEVALLNEDHSLAPALDRLAAEGEITAEAARNDPRRHMLRSAITGDDIDLVDLSRKPLALAEGDFVILASDGLNTLEPTEVARIIVAHGAGGAATAADALVRAVLDVGEAHQDNVTVIVVSASARPTER